MSPLPSRRLAAFSGLVVAAAAVTALPAAATPEHAGQSVRVSLAAPAEVKRGRAADLGVAVTAPATGDRVPGVTVILYGRPPRGGGWAEAGRAVTNARGVASLRAVPTRTTDYAAEALPLRSYDGGTSGIVRVKVRR